ncbi:hypothetical protein NQZ79_g2008 [Umbelopsis isabellina]|nr:hypothetical protein NQZ79_g2008 [Umbelopsis isabellina]
MLTEQLLALDPDSYYAATEHQLLEEIGSLQLPPYNMRAWMVQDKFYTGGYINMLAKMMDRLPKLVQETANDSDDLVNEQDITKRLYKNLSFAHENIIREAGFFDNLIKRYESPSAPDSINPLTQDYVDFQQRVTEESDSHLGEAVILLWAMERVFYDAWSYAGSLLKDIPASVNDSEHVKTIRELVDNWTSPDFKKFVDECAFHVNALPVTSAGQMDSYEQVFQDMLVFEQKFWDLAYEI